MWTFELDVIRACYSSADISIADVPRCQRVEKIECGKSCILSLIHSSNW